jgi:DNA-binding transcriptional MocR family regulator
VAALVRARAEEGGGDLDLLAWALRDMLLDGVLLRQVRKARTAYRSRRDQAFEGLRTVPGLTPRLPASGLGLWIEGEDLETWRKGAEAVGIALRPASHWALGPDGPRGLLFPFSRLEEIELKDVLELLRRVRR